jgi:hypothetical protein
MGQHEYDVRAPHDGMSASKYIATRFTTLKPPFLHVPNPIKLVRMLNAQQWAFFFVAFAAWTWDAFDFFSVSLTVSSLAKTFDKSNTDITWGITLVLMFRSVGSILFGVAADRYGRKWPFVVNNLLFIVLELVRQSLSSPTALFTRHSKCWILHRWQRSKLRRSRYQHLGMRAPISASPFRHKPTKKIHSLT